MSYRNKIHNLDSNGDPLSVMKGGTLPRVTADHIRDNPCCEYHDPDGVEAIQCCNECPDIETVEIRYGSADGLVVRTETHPRPAIPAVDDLSVPPRPAEGDYSDLPILDMFPVVADPHLRPDDVVVIDMWEVNQREMERRVAAGEPLPLDGEGRQITPEQVAAWRAERGPGEIHESTGKAVANQGPTGVRVLVPLDSAELVQISEEVGADERCVAACGLPADGNEADRSRTACPVHPDGAHRCFRRPGHLADHGQPDETGGVLKVADHQCDCGYIWISLSGGMREINKLLTVGAGNALRRAIRDLDAAMVEPLAIHVVQRVAREMGATL